jgi:hypothetical protein
MNTKKDMNQQGDAKYNLVIIGIDMECFMALIADLSESKALSQKLSQLILQSRANLCFQFRSHFIMARSMRTSNRQRG